MLFQALSNPDNKKTGGIKVIAGLAKNPIYKSAVHYSKHELHVNRCCSTFSEERQYLMALADCKREGWVCVEGMMMCVYV